MDVYFFTSNSLRNIERGVSAKLWAVPPPGARADKSVRTKARELKVNSYGVLYCSQTKSLTVPFRVTSEPDQVRLVRDVWPGVWALPFMITPLGTTDRQMPRDTIMRTLNVARQSHSNNLSHVLPITPTQVFSPLAMPDADWEILVRNLAD